MSARKIITGLIVFAFLFGGQKQISSNTKNPSTKNMDTIVVLSPLFGNLWNELNVTFPAKLPDLANENPDGSVPLRDIEITIEELTDDSFSGGVFTQVIHKNFTALNFLSVCNVNSSDIITNITYADYDFGLMDDVVQPSIGTGLLYQLINGYFERDEYNFVSPLYVINVRNELLVPFFKAGAKINLHMEKHVSWFKNWYVMPNLTYSPSFIKLNIDSPGGMLPRNPPDSPITIKDFTSEKHKTLHNLLAGVIFRFKLWYILDVSAKFNVKFPLNYEHQLTKDRNYLYIWGIRGNLNLSRHFAIAFFTEYAERSTTRNFFWFVGPAYAFY